MVLADQLLPAAVSRGREHRLRAEALTLIATVLNMMIVGLGQQATDADSMDFVVDVDDDKAASCNAASAA